MFIDARRCVPVMLIAALVFAADLSGEGREPIRQNLQNGDHLLVEDDTARLPDIIQSSQRLQSRDRYQDTFMNVGLHIRTGRTTDMTSNIRMQNLNTCHVIGAHGKGTHVRYRGTWDAAGGNAFPHLILTEGGRFTFEAQAKMNLVLQGSFFTRQLWVMGDNTGILELAEGFVADRTTTTPLPDALGTIRLGGATLITHHTRNMPSNTRPDGRGGSYQNGHVVFERIPGNRWIVKTNNQIYQAQVDFDTSGTIETQADLLHVGHRRIALSVGPGGHFTSTGAFRTTSPDVTITKTGPAMLSLDGEQSYYPNSQLHVKQGLLRMSTDPGMGKRTQSQAGVYLAIHVSDEARLHLAAPVMRVERFTLSDKVRAWLDRDCRLEATQGLHVEDDATWHVNGSIHGEMQVQGTLAIDAAHGTADLHGPTRIDGTLSVALPFNLDTPALTAHQSLRLAGPLRITLTGRRPADLPQSITLLRAQQLEGRFEGETRHTTADNRYTFTLVYQPDRIEITNIQPTE